MKTPADTMLDPAKLQELESFIITLKPQGKSRAARRAVLIQVLHRAQESFGYLPKAVQKLIAARLDLHVSEVYGVVSFYHFFKLKPQGRHSMDFCTGTACFVRGAAKLVEETERALGVKLGETTADGRFTLGSLRCVGACSLAPVVQIDGKIYGRVTAAQLPDLLAAYK